MPSTFDGRDEPVGVIQAHGQQVHLLPAEQRVDAGSEVTGRLDRKFHQAFGGAVHQPPPPPAVHAAAPARRARRWFPGPWHGIASPTGQTLAVCPA